jgi:hypothetical protein
MNPLDALGNLINSWGWLIFLGLFLGGGDFFGRLLDGRRKVSTLRIQRDEARSSRDRLETQLDRALGGKGGTAAIARDTLSVNAKLIDLLGQVQASDQALPQLPTEVRDRIDAVLSDRWDDKPTAKKGTKSS